MITTFASCNVSRSKTKEKSMKMIYSEIVSKNIVKDQTDKVWNKLIAFGGTEKFVPKLIEKVIVEGKGIGAVRYIHLKGGGEIIERLTKIDSTNHQMEFIIISTPMPISNYTGIFFVDHISNNKCEVTFTSKFNVSKENKNEMESVIKGFQETFISNLDK